MGKMNVGRMAADFQTTSNVQRKKDQKDTTEDFKKLLKDKPEGEQEVPKDTDTVKEEKVPVQKTEKPEINETLAALQMAYALRGGSIPVQQEETAEATADVDVLNIAPESVIPVNTMPQDEEVQAADGRVDVQEGQTEAVQGRSTEGMQEKVQSVQTADSVHTEAAPKAEKKAKPENIVKKDETVSTGVNAQENQASQIQTHTEAREHVSPVSKNQMHTERLHVEKPEEIPQKISEELLAKTSNGVNEFEIQIEPEHLGKIAIKVLYEHGQTTVQIACSEKRTQELIGQNAREIGNVMERNLGEETTVYVEKQTPDYLNQNGKENDHSGRESEQERQREENRKHKTEDAAQFLQKLRLGLSD